MSPKKKRIARFVVELELPSDATKTDVRGYIEECVRSWRGSLFPGNDFEPPDPMWDLDPDTVKVSFYRRGKRTESELTVVGRSTATPDGSRDGGYKGRL